MEKYLIRIEKAIFRVTIFTSHCIIKPVMYRNVRTCLLFILLPRILVKGQNQNSLLEFDEPYSNSEYGFAWMYFPDGDGVPRRIPLDFPSASILRRAEVFYLDSDIQYRLYTRRNIEDYILLDQTGKPINRTIIPIGEMLSSAPIKVITHGWESSADKNAVINIKNAYLNTQDVNVIGVDWSSVADNLLYPIVAYQTTVVGGHVAKFLNTLGDLYNVSGDQIHLIGHSLGAHVMGNAGHETKLKIDRITGLDPARPLFEFPSRPDSAKLDAMDAKFVDIIHTCGGVLGVEGTFGHADFYPNSGFAPQPGCLGYRQITEACSHSRSHFFFTESILHPASFPAYRCDGWEEYLQNKCSRHTYMGEFVNRSETGNFYLETNQAMPYGKGLDLSNKY